MNFAPPVYNEKQPSQQTGQDGGQLQGYLTMEQAYPPIDQAYPSMEHTYPSPQQGYVPSTTQTTIVTQPAVVTPMAIAFHETPLNITCPICRSQVVTTVRYDNGSFVWLLFVILCVAGLWPCALIPFCVRGCQDAIHSCPTCNAQVGVYRRM